LRLCTLVSTICSNRERFTPRTWGCYERAKIIHFQGPKPFQRDEIDTVWPELKSYTGGAYLELIEVWQELLKKARSS
jgi:hypothetical protein